MPTLTAQRTVPRDGDGDGMVAGPDGRDNVPASGATAAPGDADADLRARIAELKARPTPKTLEEAERFRADARAILVEKAARERAKAAVGAVRMPNPGEVGSLENPEPVPEPPEGPTAGRAYLKSLRERTGELAPAERDAIGDYMSVTPRDMRAEDAGAGSQHVQDFYAGWSKLPAYDGDAFRGLKRFPASAVQAVRASGDLELEAMSSFSRSPAVGLRFARTVNTTPGTTAAMLVMKSRTMRHTEHLGRAPEREVIAAKGTRLRVTGMRYVRFGRDPNVTLLIEGEER